MASNFTGRNLMSRALAVSFIITNFVMFAMSSWYQNRKFEDLYSFKGADFPLNPSVPWSTKGVGVHFFGDLLESVKIVSTSGSPYIKASGTYLPFTYAVLRIFGSIDYPLLCLMFLISVAVGIAVVTQISYKLNSNIGRIDILIILLSASIPFRQEYRWLLAPYIALIVIVHVAAGVIADSRRTQMLLGALLVTTGSIVGLYYSRYAESTYFFQTQHLGDSINDQIFVQYRDQIATTTFVVINYDDTVYNWAVGGQLFYQEYSPSQNLIHYRASLQTGEDTQRRKLH